jgi:outer membrane lipoprotein-sorting protein
MKKLLIGVTTAALIVSMSGVASAQGRSNPASAAMDKISKILNQQSLTARVVATVPTTGESKVPQIEFLMTMSKGKSRIEMDMGKMMGAASGGKSTMPAGMGKMVTITRPDKKVIYQVMPDLNAYCEMQIPDATAGKAEVPKMDRKVQGTEMVDKYKCQKVLTTVTTKDGTTVDIMTWEAKEFGGMPIKMETDTPQGKMTMLFKDIKTDTPAASLFEPPAGATKHASMQEMMMSAMMQNMQQPR